MKRKSLNKANMADDLSASAYSAIQLQWSAFTAVSLYKREMKNGFSCLNIVQGY
jgi:hypothetical protein